MSLNIADLALFFFSLASLVTIPNCICYLVGNLGCKISEKIGLICASPIHNLSSYKTNLIFYALYTVIVNVPLSQPLIIDFENSIIGINLQSLLPYFAVLAITGFLGFGLLRTTTLSVVSLAILLVSSGLFPELELLKTSYLSTASLLLLTATTLTFST